MLKNRNKILLLVSILLATTLNVTAKNNYLSTFKFPEGIKISVPSNWVVFDKKRLKKYNIGVSSDINKFGINMITPVDKVKRLFRAEKNGDGVTTTVTLTVAPEELTQTEINNWTSKDMKTIGDFMIEHRKKAAKSVGMKNIFASPPYKKKISGKIAFCLPMSFSTPRGNIHMKSDSCFIYQKNMTVILTFEKKSLKQNAKSENTRIISNSLVIQ